MGFLGGSVVKNVPDNVGDTGSIPGSGLLQSFSVLRLPLKHVFTSKGNELLDNKRLALMHALFGFQELPYNYTALDCMSEVCFSFNIL